MDRRFNFVHNYAKKVWWIDNQKFLSDKGTNNGKQKAIAYAREHMLDDKSILKFDSEMEFKRFLYLHARADRGEITELKDHFNFQLLPAFINANGIFHEELVYEADFYYFDVLMNKYVVEDVKGNLEDVFRVKWKLFDRIYEKKGLSIACIRMRNGKHYNPISPDSWYEFSENRKSTKRTDKMKAELQELRTKEKERQMAEKKILKEKERLEKLKIKTKLTKIERKRLEELLEKYEPQKVIA